MAARSQHYKRGDRVSLKLDASVRGTVRVARRMMRADRTNVDLWGIWYYEVRWDDGRRFEVVQHELERSPDDGPEGLKSLLRF